MSGSVPLRALVRIAVAVEEMVTIMKQAHTDDLKVASLVRCSPVGVTVSCPTCGRDCTIGGDDVEGTHYYIPKKSS